MNIPHSIRPERRDWLPILALALGISVQTGGVIWWASGINGRVESVERELAKAEIARTALAAQIELLQSAQSQSAAFMARIDERLTGQGAQLSRMERMLEGALP